MNKKNNVLLILNVVCFIIVLTGSLIRKKDNIYIDIMLGMIILVSIIVQIVAIIKEEKEKHEN